MDTRTDLLIAAIGNGGTWTRKVVLEHLLKPDDPEANRVCLNLLKLQAAL